MRLALAGMELGRINRKAANRECLIARPLFHRTFVRQALGKHLLSTNDQEIAATGCNAHQWITSLTSRRTTYIGQHATPPDPGPTNLDFSSFSIVIRFASFCLGKMTR